MELQGLQDKLDKLKRKAAGLKAKIGELKMKVSEARKVGVTNFKESDTYKLAFNTIAT